jgi:hypothetical protein
MDNMDEKSQEQKPDIEQSKAQILSALIMEESNYEIDVVDNSMLPDHLKKKEVMEFVIKPPVLDTLNRMAKVAMRIPEEHRQIDTAKEISIQYIEEIVEILAIMVHGNSKKPMPEWYVPFFMKNCNTEDLFKLYQESSMKIRTDFFLPCFQTANVLNPMMMINDQEKEKLASIRSGS